MAYSCDTLVALPPATHKGCVVFGKNSDRPDSEVQEVVYLPAADYPVPTNVKCTYIDIPQSAHTHAVILSKPEWMWGAEMGANEHGVVIGNEAVWTKLTGPGSMIKRLLGMDLLRLGLERGTSARHALDVITDLLVAHGQGGPCFVDPGATMITYCNSFIIADRCEAWVLETAASHWVAEKIESGVRNISNMLSIETKIDLMSDGLVEFAEKQGFWSPSDGKFNFTAAFSSFMPVKRAERGMPGYRMQAGRKLLDKLSANKNFGLKSMCSILRDRNSGICSVTSGFPSVASQVSILPPPGSDSSPIHWFTATPNPARSLFKPFVFVPDVKIGKLTKSPDGNISDRRHELYRAHDKVRPLEDAGDNDDEKIIADLMAVEETSIRNIEILVADLSSPEKLSQAAGLFKSATETEMKLYA